MTKAIYYSMIVFVILFFSCNSEQKDENMPTTINVLFDNTEGLSPGAPVETRGLKIGEVVSLRVKDHEHILVEAQIEKGNKIPKGSDFVLKMKNDLFKKYIEIRYAESDEYYSNGDEVIGKEETLSEILNPELIDSVMKPIGQMFKGFKEAFVKMADTLKKEFDNIEIEVDEKKEPE